MATDDFFRARLDQMIDLRHPLAVLANRLPWAQIESALAPVFARKNRQGQAVAGSDLFGTSLQIAGAGISAAGRPRLPIRLMAALLYLKHAFNLSDEELVTRWSENVVWQYFSGQEYYTPEQPCDATQIGRFRTAIGPNFPALNRTRARPSAKRRSSRYPMRRSAVTATHWPFSSF